MAFIREGPSFWVCRADCKKIDICMELRFSLRFVVKA